MFARVLDTPLVLENSFIYQTSIYGSKIQEDVNFFKRMTIYSENLFLEASYTPFIDKLAG